MSITNWQSALCAAMKLKISCQSSCETWVCKLEQTENKLATWITGKALDKLGLISERFMRRFKEKREFRVCFFFTFAVSNRKTRGGKIKFENVASRYGCLCFALWWKKFVSPVELFWRSSRKWKQCNATWDWKGTDGLLIG